MACIAMTFTEDGSVILSLYFWCLIKTKTSAEEEDSTIKHNHVDEIPAGITAWTEKREKITTANCSHVWH